MTTTPATPCPTDPVAPLFIGPAPPSSPPLLERIVAAGHMRYWVIICWGLALLTVVRPEWVTGWLAATFAAGFGRGWVEARALGLPPRRRKPTLTAVATLSCLAWAAAPWLAWADGGEEGVTLAIGLIGVGLMLIFTQRRAEVREAFVISTPYIAILIAILIELRGHSAFWVIVGLLPVFGSALVIKVVMTQIRDRDIGAVLEAQQRLILDLEQARDQAQTASRTKSDFLAVITHELRTPLNGVLGAAQLMDAGRLDPAQRDLLTVLTRSGQSLLSLLNDMLDTMKIESGALALDPQPVSAPDLQRQIIGSFAHAAESCGLVFSVEVQGAWPDRLILDARRVAQVVHHLLANAIKFTAAGRVRLTLSAEPGASADRTDLLISVADDGIGISTDDLTRLFKPFSQVDGSSTRRFGGAGLGLNIARRLALLMEGDLHVTSTVGAGSVFSLRLPNQASQVTTASPVEPEPAVLTGEARLRILVAEDHPVNRMILETWISSLDHAVTTACNGREAVDLAAVQAYDVILMDINMPIMDGLAAILEIRRSSGPNRDAPVIVLSASAGKDHHDRGFAVGADAYLDKPVDFSTLAELLASAAGGRIRLQAATRPVSGRG